VSQRSRATRASLAAAPAAGVGQPFVRLGAPSGLRDYLHDQPVTTDAPSHRDLHDGVLHWSAQSAVRVTSPSWRTYDARKHTLFAVGSRTLIDGERLRIVLPGLRTELATQEG
jgi:hypothetical protein